MVEEKLKSKYLAVEYFQKSLWFLLPLISKEKQQGIINTYLYAEELEESIDDGYLICEMAVGTELNEELQKCLESSYSCINGNELNIFNINEWKEDVKKFLRGEYSQFTQKAKDKILIYYGYKIYIRQTKEYAALTVEELKNSTDYNSKQPKMYAFFYPDEFKEDISREIFLKFYGTEEEAYNILKKEFKELCCKYDIEREIYKGLII